MPKISKETTEVVLMKLEMFEKLERKATDEIGWIALGFSVSRLKASRMIERARELAKKKMP